MKRTLLKNYNALIAMILTILGVGSACSLAGHEYGTARVEYGTPSATYKVTGTVKSQNNTVLRDIQVTMAGDTTFTDMNGVYNTAVERFPLDQTFEMKFEDTNGEQNGAFQSKDTTVAFINPQFVNGDGDWYEGETSKEINIKLKSAN